MASFGEKIAALKTEIAGYEADYDAATSSEEKDLLLGLIKSTREYLSKLLDQQKSK